MPYFAFLFGFKRPTALIFGLLFFLAFFPIVQIASATGAIPRPEKDQQLSDLVPKGNLKQSFPETDKNSGALVYNYSFNLPQGRKGLQPDLQLEYNSQAGEDGSLFGYGWKINIPYIERRNLHGADQLYTRQDFVSSVSGELLPIAPGSSTFMARTESGQFLSYYYDSSSSSWTVKDKSGLTYIYGKTANDRMDDPSDEKNIFKWQLSEVTDSSGNFVRYSYFKDQGQIYPQTVSYTGNADNAGIFRVEFSRQQRADNFPSFKTGFQVVTDYTIGKVGVYVNNTLGKEFLLTYAPGNNGLRSMLQAIQETGYVENGLKQTFPPTSFDYGTSNETFFADPSFSLPNPGDSKLNFEWGDKLTDVNGDGLVDYLSSWDGINIDDTTHNNQVYIQKPDKTWQLSSTYKIPFLFFSQGCCSVNYGIFLMTDVNGDGKVDFVSSWDENNNGTVSVSEVWLNNGSNWVLDPNWSVPVPIMAGGKDNEVRTQDLNGDGLVDLYIRGRYVSAQNKQRPEEAYFNTGSGWTVDPIPNFDPPATDDPSSAKEDFNNDGISDIIRSEAVYQTHCQTNNKAVALSNGRGGELLYPSLIPPVIFAGNNIYCPPFERGVTFVDLDGDGIKDILQAASYTFFDAYAGTGKGWVQKNRWKPSVALMKDNHPTYNRLVDFNADGLPDLWDNDSKTALINGNKKADLLKKVTMSSGGVMEVSYKPSTQYLKNDGSLANPNLPAVIHTVEKVTTTDTLTNLSSQVSYDYSGGEFYFNGSFDKKFAGFGLVTTTSNTGKITKTYYHQGNATNSAQGESLDDYYKIGQPYREETWESGNAAVVMQALGQEYEMAKEFSQVEKTAGAEDSSKGFVVEAASLAGSINTQLPAGQQNLADFTVPVSQKASSAQTDHNTGALNYTYPINVPAGRDNLQPEINISYNNQFTDNGSISGLGWGLNIPYIERLNKTGVDQLYAKNIFNSSLSGELIENSAGLYSSKVEDGSFLSYAFLDNSWTVKSKNGLTYKFGATASARQDNPKDSSQVFKWMLEEVKDSNGNIISYEYFKDSGQIYPLKISYGGSNAFTVDFTTGPTSSPSLSFKTGFQVKTQYRILSISISFGGNWIKKYMLGFAVGANTTRSLLQYITESGKAQDGSIVTQPPTTFEYEKSTPGWQFSGVEPIDPPVNEVSGLRIVADVNSDGLPDYIFSYDGCSNYPNPQNCNYPWYNHVYINKNNKEIVRDDSYVLPVYFFANENQGGIGGIWPQGALFADLNGDNYADIVQIKQANHFYDQPLVRKVFINDKNGHWVENPTFANTISAVWADQTPVQVFDINGDGLVDISFNNTGHVQLNTGTSFSEPTNAWKFPADTQDPNVRLLDMNADGLIDIAETKVTNNGYDVKSNVYLNKGNGQWSLEPSLTFPTPLGTFVDINGDGLPDMLRNCEYGSDIPPAYINTGTAWIENTQYSLPSYTCKIDNRTLFYDSNGDGLADKASLLRLGKVPDLLTKINLPTGGNISVSYKASTDYKNSQGEVLNPELPFTLQTVEQLKSSDGNGNVTGETYSYEGGVYNFKNVLDRKWAGFGKVTKVNAAGAATHSYYHQGNVSNTALGEFEDQASKIGQPFRVEAAGNGGQLYSVVIKKWDSKDLGNGRSFVKLAQTTSLDFDGNSSHKDKAEGFTYDDANGNLISKTSYGEVLASDNGSFTDTGSDKIVTNIFYAVGGQMFLPSAQTNTNQSGLKIGESKWYYDNLPLGQLSYGNQTKEELWNGGANYIASSKTYNSFGLVTSQTDPLGAVTSFAYDQYNLYPASQTNALQQVTQYVYNYAAGKPKTITDPNGLVQSFEYDGFGRILKESVTDPANLSALALKSSYTYTDTPLAVGATKTSYLKPAGQPVWELTYYDGLGRLVQERKQTEAPISFWVTDTVYDSAGRVLKKSLPYVSFGSSKTAATADNGLYTTFSYDPLDRVIQTTNVLGLTQTAYDDWSVTSTDVLGNKKRLTSDSYGRLVKVDEYNSSAAYTTTYNYDDLGNLTKITDALGNIRNFTYDQLGRRLSVEDLHAATDTVFGKYIYTYDATGNLTSKLDPNAITVNYTYDQLGRQKTEDRVGTTAVEVTYTYDICVKGIGRKCKAQFGSNSTSYSYDILGRVINETKLIDSKTYKANYVYDLLGNLTKVDDGVRSFFYAYNPAGLLETVGLGNTASSTQASQSIVTNIDYAPTGAVKTINYANGTKTENTFDPAQLYRLTAKNTSNVQASSTLTTLQDLQYQYDTIGNILKLTENADTSLKREAVYAYDPLYRLTSSALTLSGGQPVAQTYSYNAIGNILSKSDVGNYTYAGAASGYNNPHAADKMGLAKLTYDNNGNVKTIDDTTITPANDPPWMSGLTNWKYRKKFSVTLTSPVVATTTANTVLIKMQDDKLKSAANGGLVAKDNGNDFYTVNASSTVRTYFTLENYNPVTGELALRMSPVLNPNSATTTVEGAVYFGYAGVTTSYQYPSSVWSGMRLGFNFSENLSATTTVTDLASYKYNGEAKGFSSSTPQTSLIGSGIKFDGVDDRVEIAAGKPNVSNLTNISVSFWLKPTAVSSSTPMVLLDKTLTSTSTGWKLRLLPDNSLELTQNYTLLPIKIITASSTVPAGQTNNIVVTIANAGQVLASNFKIYVNGKEAAYVIKQDGKGTRPTDLNNPLIIGNCYAANCGFSGVMDEFWIYGRLLTPDAVANIYKLNLASPSVGGVETYGTNTSVSRKIGNTFDYNNRITKTTVGTAALSFTYDDVGQRNKVLETVGTSTVSTVYYPFKFYNKKTVGTKFTETEHIFVGDMLVATVETSGTSIQIYFQHPDHLSGANVTTNNIGDVVETTDYYPFGEIRVNNKSGSFSEQRKFIGEEYDQLTALSYLNARYYDGKLGKFMGEDPAFWNGTHLSTQLADPQSWNSYSYARNNPLKFNDPHGQFWKEFAQGKYDRYNPMNILFGADTNAYVNGLATGNLKQAGGSLVNIAGTTALTIVTALDIANIAADTTFVYRANNRNKIYQQELQGIENKTAQRSAQIQSETQGKLYGSFGNYIPEIESSALPQSAQNSLQAYQKNGWQKINGLKAQNYRNDEGFLPSGQNYREFDVNPKIGPTRDSQRFFVGSDDNSVYYTDSHMDPSQGTIVNKIK